MAKQDMWAKVLPISRRPRIVIRKPSFDHASMRGGSTFFVEENSILTAFVVALSAQFPPGEKEFIRSVMAFRDRVSDPELQISIREFAGQEAQHARVHEETNAVLDALGYRASWITSHLEKFIAGKFPRFSNYTNLAFTVSLEHMTALMAEFMLTRGELFEDAPPSFREMYLWHAAEEIEHKAVAFDVYKAVNGNPVVLRRVFRFATLMFFLRTSAYTALLIRWQQHRPSLAELRSAAEVFFGPDGMFPTLRKPWADFLRDDFHPWDHDNRDLVEAWKAKYAEVTQVAQ